MKALRFAMLCGMSGAMKAPPLIDARRLTLSYKTLASRAAEGVNAAFVAGHRRVSVEIPQISSVDRSTIARRFEDDNNWLLALIAILGGRRPEPIGAQVSIFEGGFEGGLFQVGGRPAVARELQEKKFDFARAPRTDTGLQLQS